MLRQKNTDHLLTPPLRDGIGASFQWLPNGAWKTILDFLVEQFPAVSYHVWISRMERALVLDEMGVVVSPATPYRVGAKIYYYREVDDEPSVPFEASVIYENEHILVADKPHFLPVAPSGRFVRETLLVRLRKSGQYPHLAPMHRIDRETAGLVLFSVNPGTRGVYSSLFAKRLVTKVYEALAPRRDELTFPIERRSRLVTGEPFFRTQEVAGDANSETHIELFRKHGNATALYRVRPVTGKKHQIRVHFAELGMPIINDKLYPDVAFGAVDEYSRPLKLLAKSLSFQDPLSGRLHSFESGFDLF